MSDVETDDAGIMEFASLESRVSSFNGTSLVEKVPAGRMARAGLFYTGHGEKVQCFSCSKILDNWSREDFPVERHKAVSPTCSFIRCIYPNSSPMRRTDYNEEAESFEYRLRTGAVVDETTYPKVPHMRSEEARLQTFSCWPASSHMRPCDLAQAGLYYLRQEDHVQCFCCGGMLGRWDQGDSAWGEHEKHYSNCHFVLGHDVGNIPLQGASQEEGNRRCHVHMGTFEERLQSFQDINHPISHELLAQAGLYSTGKRDQVLCFTCGGGLKGWQPEEDPWVEHAKHYPGCRFLLTEKGQEFINHIQLQGTAATSQHNGFSKDNEECVKEKEDEDPMKKLEKLQRERLCKICMDRDIAMVFIPCGHMVACHYCSDSLINCPICISPIKQKIKTYNS
ncbi:E3 ubiquitin-protein ligase XIAP isoform X2 [Eucyclogobius newberryi]|uniref:E3 ubiquitin-protein ligase XIAP isoform X2 n=1 Tax=Eucyclogobius newberryi TaxID=166745 RepID=UPI003B59CAB4